MKEKLPSSLIEAIKNTDLAKVTGEFLEIGIDTVLENGLLRDFPIINTITGFWNTGIAIRDYRFLNPNPKNFR